MGHWIKHFVDGSKYIGEDDDVAVGRASWRRSPIENICCVELYEGDVYLGISGFGCFWQSDLMTASFSEGKSTVLSRSIQKRIEDSDAFVCKEQNGNQLSIKIYRFPPTCRMEMFPIQKYMIGKWLTLTYNFKSGVSFSLQDDKL